MLIRASQKLNQILFLFGWAISVTDTMTVFVVFSLFFIYINELKTQIMNRSIHIYEDFVCFLILWSTHNNRASVFCWYTFTNSPAISLKYWIERQRNVLGKYCWFITLNTERKVHSVMNLLLVIRYIGLYKSILWMFECSVYRCSPAIRNIARSFP